MVCVEGQLSDQIRVSNTFLGVRMSPKGKRGSLKTCEQRRKAALL